MNSKEGQDTHNGTLRPAKPLRASKDPLSQTQGGYRTKSFHQVLSFKHLPCFFFKKIIKNICIGQSGHMLGQRQKNRRLWVGLQVCKALSSQPGSLPELLQEAPCLWRLSFLTC